MTEYLDPYELEAEDPEQLELDLEWDLGTACSLEAQAECEACQ